MRAVILALKVTKVINLVKRFDGATSYISMQSPTDVLGNRYSTDVHEK